MNMRSLGLQEPNVRVGKPAPHFTRGGTRKSSLYC
jgi:hypothetical protein